MGFIKKAEEIKTPINDKFKMGSYAFLIMAGMFIFYLLGSLPKGEDEAIQRIEQMESKISQQVETLTLKVNKDGTDVIAVKNIIMAYADTSIHIESLTALKLAEQIVYTANRYPSVSISLLTSLIYQESAFNWRAVSHAGARGLTQMMPATQAWVCLEWRLTCTDDIAFDPSWSIRAGAWYLDWLHKKSKVVNKQKTLKLAYYNGGGRQAWRYSLYEKSENGIKLTELEEHFKNILAKETFNYVHRIMHMDSVFNNLIRNQLPTG